MRKGLKKLLLPYYFSFLTSKCVNHILANDPLPPLPPPFERCLSVAGIWAVFLNTLHAVFIWIPSLLPPPWPHNRSFKSRKCYDFYWISQEGTVWKCCFILQPYPLACPCIKSPEPHGQIVDFFKVFNLQYDKWGVGIFSVGGGCSREVAERSAVLLKMLIYPRYKIKGHNGNFQTLTFLTQDHKGSLREML